MKALVQSVQLTDGPSKYDLSAALFDAHNRPRKVSFGTTHGYFEAIILSVEAEDGSRESWNIVGSTQSEGIGNSAMQVGKWAKGFQLYYSTKTRKGVLTHIEE